MPNFSRVSLSVNRMESGRWKRKRDTISRGASYLACSRRNDDLSSSKKYISRGSTMHEDV